MIDAQECSAVILDRDGVINQETGDYVKTVTDFEPIAGSIEAIARLYKSGFRVFVATNQSGIGRGLYNEQTLADIHQKLYNLVTAAGGQINAIHYCPHIDEDACDCRKPKAGLLKQIAGDHHIDLSKAIMIGDSIRDLQAALAVGVEPVLVTSGKHNQTTLNTKLAEQAQRIAVYSDLAAFVDEFLTNL